jgi:hypothetical protein
MNDKALRHFKDLSVQEDGKPDVIGVVEVHLQGTELNKIRRKMKSIGWRMFATPATTKTQQQIAAQELAPCEEQEEQAAS